MRESQKHESLIRGILLVVLLNIVAFWTIIYSVEQIGKVGFKNRGQSELLKFRNLRKELENRVKREQNAILTKFQQNYEHEDRARIYYGVSKYLPDPSDTEILAINVHKRCHSGIVAKRGKELGSQTIWVYEVDYPTSENENCIRFKYQDGIGAKYEAAYADGCKRIYEMLLTWMSSSRVSKVKVAGSDIPVPSEGTETWGVAFMANNPAHAALWFWNKADEILSPSLEYIISSFKHIENPDDPRYDTIEGEVLDKDFKKHKFTFHGWFKRNRLSIRELTKVMKQKSRSFDVKRIVPVEGKEYALSDASKVLSVDDVIDFIVEKGKPRAITAGGVSIIPSDMSKMIEITWNPRDPICMQMKIKAPSGEQKYFAETNCGVLYVEYERFLNSK